MLHVCALNTTLKFFTTEGEGGGGGGITKNML